MLVRNVVIVGSGPAGLTCAIYTARAGLGPIIIGGSTPGGQLITTDLIENFPGFDAISGPDLMMKMISQAEGCGAELRYDNVFSIEKVDDNFLVKLVSGEPIVSRTVVVASGASHRHLGVIGEQEFLNKGVSYCATCDGPMYRGKKTAVVGGGNTAVMEALFLSKFCEKVYLIHRRDTLRAEPLMQKRLHQENNVEILWHSEIRAICGLEKMEHVQLHNNKDNTVSNLQIDGLFVAIGTQPSSEFVKELVSLDSEGYILSEFTKTSCPGIFAAGDVVSGSIKQAIVAAGEGCIAAKHISHYLGA